MGLCGNPVNVVVYSKTNIALVENGKGNVLQWFRKTKGLLNLFKIKNGKNV